MKYTKNISFILLFVFIFALPLTAHAQGLEDIAKILGDAIGGVSSFVGSIPVLGEFLGGLGDLFGGIANAFLKVLILVLFGGPLIIAAIFWMLAGTLLQFVLSPEFLSLPITSPQNKVVYDMWVMVRDFANMGFILVAVAIGLGTALRYGEYQLQKALPRLIAIALLINFTPVIVGFFIDAANIVIRFLVSQSVGDNLAQFGKMAMDVAINTVSVNVSAAEYLAAIVAQIFYYIVATIVYLLYFILYFFRYVALIILFILSPLAFFSFVLPITKRFWDMWWNQFIAWLTIGIAGAFFLLLAAQMSGAMWAANITNDVGKGVFQFFNGFLDVFVKSFASIGILILGFLFSLQTSAMGAQTIIAVSKRTGGRLYQAGSKRVYSKGRGIIGSSQKVRRISELQPPTNPLARALWYPTVGVARFTARQLRAQTQEAEARAIEKEKEEAKKIKTPEMLYSLLKAPAATRAQRIGRLLAAVENKQLNVLRNLGLTDEEISRTAEDTLRFALPQARNLVSPFGPEAKVKLREELVSRGFTDDQLRTVGLQAMTPAEETRYGGNKEENYVRKYMAEARPRDIENWTQGDIIDQATQQLRGEIGVALREYGRGEQLRALAQNFGLRAVEAIMLHLDDVGREWLEKYNPQLLNYLKSNAGQELGFREPRSSPDGFKKYKPPPGSPGSTSPPSGNPSGPSATGPT
jgi:hypothetical protein